MKEYKVIENSIEYDVKEYGRGSKYWFLNGKRHREDGPAVEYSNGDKVWYLNGKLHREDGPAIEYANGDKSWFLDSIQYSKEEYGNKISQIETKRLTNEIDQMFEEIML